MNLNNVSFPYPVLGSFDDILPAPEEPKVDIYADKTNYHFSIDLAYKNKEIENWVFFDCADYVCEVSCDATRYRRCYRSKELHFDITIPRRSVAGRINFSCTITVKKPIQNYKNKNFHPDYSGHTFNMEPGDLLGMFSPFYYFADIKYDKLKAVGTFMQIVETDDDIPSTALEKDKIELRLPQNLYNQYLKEPAVNSKVDILHASIVLSSLTYALCRIEQYTNNLWAETILYRIQTEPELEEFKEQAPSEWRVDKLSQILLGKPYERMFNYLLNNDNSIE